MSKPERTVLDTGLWVEQTEAFYRIGLAESAQEEIGDISYAELPSEERTLRKGDLLLSVEGDKAVTELTAPFSARIIQWHTELEESPEKLNRSDSDDTWIVECERLDDNEEVLK